MNRMRVVIIGTDHRLQHSIVQEPLTKAWVPRKGGHRYRRLIVYCVEKLDVKAILEEAHPDQERTAPTIASTVAKEHGVGWQALGLGEPGLSDVLLDPPLMDAVRSGTKSEMLAGIYNLELQAIREEFMCVTIKQFIREHDCVLAVVGYTHLGVLARMFETESIPVKAFLFTYPLLVDETRS
jgi:hypothetical protein